MIFHILIPLVHTVENLWKYKKTWYFDVKKFQKIENREKNGAKVLKRKWKNTIFQNYKLHKIYWFL